ncbi:MAG: hemerythrin domain-containing protein [Pseudomonadota bacterium]|nr:hemerythrin domain-containing protein [Pseudomonadota bacterium]
MNTESVDTSERIATMLGDEHGLIDETCRRLEEIADSLPHDVDLELVASVLPAIRGGITAHCRAEENDLLATLLRRMPDDLEVKWTAALIRQEHAELEASGLEVQEALEDLAATGHARDPGALGYMLRHYFVGLRRHMAWEDRTLLRMASALDLA